MMFNGIIRHTPVPVSSDHASSTLRHSARRVLLSTILLTLCFVFATAVQAAAQADQTNSARSAIERMLEAGPANRGVLLRLATGGPDPRQQIDPDNQDHASVMPVLSQFQ